jgi:predicted small metal-binding protein
MKMLVLALAVVCAFAFSSHAYSQDAPKKEMPKQAKQMELKSVSCDPDCGFMVRSHDENEVIQMVKTHAKQAHNKDLTDKDVKAMIKTWEPGAMKKKS